MNVKQLLFLLAVLLPILSACKGDDQGQQLANELPLDAQRPTFAYFFTVG